MRFQQQNPTPGFEENLTRQLTSLRQSVRDDAAKNLDQLSPEASLRILSEAIEKAYLRAQRRRIAWLGFYTVYFVMCGCLSLLGAGHVMWFFLLINLSYLLRLIRGPSLLISEEKLLNQFLDKAKYATFPSSAGQILDVISHLKDFPASYSALKRELGRLLKCADDETVASLKPTQLQALAQVVRPLDNPELGIAGLLTLASARYADAELLKKTASLALTDAPLGLAAREYRRAVGEPLA